jgi:hypothetical protein
VLTAPIAIPAFAALPISGGQLCKLPRNGPKAPRLLATLKRFCGFSRNRRIALYLAAAGIVVVTLIFHESAQNTV